MTLVIKVHGIPETVEAFQDLPRTVRNKHMKIALNAGGGVIRDAMKILAPSDTGLLRRSLKVVVRDPNASWNPAHHGKPAYARIGPSRNVTGVQRFLGSGRKGSFRTMRTEMRGPRGARQEFFKASGLAVATTLRRPSRYAHLVERGVKGHAVAVSSARVLSNGDQTFGREAQHRGFSGRRFMAGAVSAAGGAAQSKVISKLHSGISEWAAKRAAKVGGFAVAA